VFLSNAYKALSVRTVSMDVTVKSASKDESAENASTDVFEKIAN
jgi:hypothetical protein